MSPSEELYIIAERIKELLDKDETVDPSDLHHLISVFPELLGRAAADGSQPSQDLQSAFLGLSPAAMAFLFSSMQDEVLGQLIANLPIIGEGKMPDKLGNFVDRPNRRLALAVSENLSPERGQAFYQFIVLVTRLVG